MYLAIIDLLKLKRVRKKMFGLTEAYFSLPFPFREQQKKHFPVSADRLHPGNTELPGVEGEQPRGGDALRGGGTLAAPGPHDVILFIYELNYKYSLFAP